MSWRELLLAAIAGDGAIEGHLRPLPALDPDEQLAIYRHAYLSRLIGALRVEANGLAALLGDDFDALATAYVRENPPRSWTLDHVADQLAGWLEARGEPAHLVDLARLDAAVQRGFSAGEIPPVTPDALARGLGALALQPHATAIRLRSDVHRFRSHAITGAPDAPPVTACDQPLVIWRSTHQMRHWEIPLGLFGILDGLARGLGVGPAIEESWAAGWIPPDRVAESVQVWFKGLAERGIVGLRS